jgi:outer membrane receptor protein involved in Fe transport
LGYVFGALAAARTFGTEANLAEELVVTASRMSQPSLELIGNTARLSEDRIRQRAHQHIHELAVQTTGTWISRVSGQEHLTAIRSPVLTGPGACGAFLMLEDGIPIRPTGFCNVNQLFEVPTELTRSVEVLRGPANALYGSNGLHGTMNFLLPEPGLERGWSGSAELGPDDFWRARLGWDGKLGGSALAAGLLADNYGGFRDASGYEQQKGFFRLRRELDSSTLLVGFSATNLDQETAGFLLGEDAYRDENLRTTNPNPEAFRKADSQRFLLRWTPDSKHGWAGADLRGYLRRSDMEFLQHFLPGQPLEENGQVSGGLMLSTQRRWRGGVVTAGIDVEGASGFLEEFQAVEVDSESAFLRETRPTGQHYDYEVLSFMAAPYAQLEVPLGGRWRAMAGVRLEYLLYDYDNQMLDGNTRDDGTECGFGGCLFNRPPDSTDDFLNLAPNLGVLYRLTPETAAYLTLSRGFRAPQATELYRLQSGQQIADLDTETIDSVELGLRRQAPNLRLEAAAFAMQKRDYIFRDANGFNISDGKSKHLGVELQAEARTDTGLFMSVAGTLARHTYDFDRAVSAGESIDSGDDVDTAPRTLASARLGYESDPGLLELEWVHQGSYYLNASNTAKYGGHDLLNLRGIWRFRPDWSVAVRLNNLTDKRYADRGDFAFGNFRYFPGRDREVFFQIAYGSP